jgi:hypothetical protein
MIALISSLLFLLLVYTKLCAIVLVSFKAQFKFLYLLASIIVFVAIFEVTYIEDYQRYLMLSFATL